MQKKSMESYQNIPHWVNIFFMKKLPTDCGKRLFLFFMFEVVPKVVVPFKISIKDISKSKTRITKPLERSLRGE